LENQRNVGESSCNSGDGTDQRVQSLMFMMMMIKIVYFCHLLFVFLSRKQTIWCAVPLIPYACNFCSKMLWLTKSEAFDKSKNRPTHASVSPSVLYTSSKKFINAVLGDLPLQKPCSLSGI
jgi:hypothetical protein